MTETIAKGTKGKLKREKGNLTNEGVGGGFHVFSYWIGASFGRVAGRMPAYPLAAAVRKLSQISQMAQKKDAALSGRWRRRGGEFIVPWTGE